MTARVAIRAALVTAAAVVLVAATPHDAAAGAYIFAGETSPALVTHPSGYTGAGGVVTVTLCIDPA